jgi:hypothetical protein
MLTLADLDRSLSAVTGREFPGAALAIADATDLILQKVYIFMPELNTRNK